MRIAFNDKTSSAQLYGPTMRTSIWRLLCSCILVGTFISSALYVSKIYMPRNNGVRAILKTSKFDYVGNTVKKNLKTNATSPTYQSSPKVKEDHTVKIKGYSTVGENHNTDPPVKVTNKSVAVTGRTRTDHDMTNKSVVVTNDPRPDHDMTNKSVVVTSRPRPNHDISINIEGRFANVMFKYASLVAIAKLNNLNPCVTNGLVLKKYFNISANVFTGNFCSKKNCKRFGERLPMFYDNRVTALGSTQNVFLNGFFQSWKYLEVVKEQIKSEFRFNGEIKKNAASQFSELTKSGVRSNVSGESAHAQRNLTFVGVHVRRGDMVDNKVYVKYGYTSPGEDYVTKATALMRKKYGDVIFVVASDDLKWAKEHVNGTGVVHVQKGNSPQVDMAILTMCNHTVMTVGSFGWWIGYLTGGDVVYYGNYPTPRTKLATLFNKIDYYPPQWIEM